MDYPRPPSAPPLYAQQINSSASWPSQPSQPSGSSQEASSCSLYIRDFPHRAIAIVSSSHALILRHSSTTSEAIANGYLASVHGGAGKSRPAAAAAGDGVPSKCMVEFSPRTRQLLHGYRSLTHRPIFGTLGLISIEGEVFLCVVTHASRVATVRPGETVEKIASVAFFSLSSSDYDDVVALDGAEQEVDFGSTYAGQSVARRDVTIEHPCLALRKLLGNGSFYYSTDFDVTNRLQKRHLSTFDLDSMDEAFLWNSFMIRPLVEFRSRLLPHERESLDGSKILTSAFRGFCRSMAIPQMSAPLKVSSSGLPSFLTIISRLSCKRAGTRFMSRGIDDDGHVANFVETETTYWSPAGTLFSYVQVRGSVPVFWEQAADLIPGRQRITVTRGPDGTQPAFDQHFNYLALRYGAVHVINLLSEAKPGEAELSQLYLHGVRHCPLHHAGDRDHALLRETHYDFHAETKGPAGYEAASAIRMYIEDSTDGFAYFLAEDTDEAGDDVNGSAGYARVRAVPVLQQEGVFRTNCLDCLDRTNLIQTLISQMAIEAFLGHLSHRATPDFWTRHRTLWADNGDALSKIYAGSGALKTSFTRHGKHSIAGAMADVRKSVQRLYHNNFVDPGRQVTIDMLLGRLVGQAPVHLFDPISDYVSIELSRRSAEFSSRKDISIWVGTFNLNGRTNGSDQDLSPWLLPDVLGPSMPEMFVVGFQEIVELSPQHIANTDPSRKKVWEQAIKACLNRRAQELDQESYVLLRSGQLVGAALCIFVKNSTLRGIKNVEGSVKKTGLSGMAGNKGAVAIRMDYANTSLCLVTAHLAAGFANYDERNRDYETIHQGLRFQRNRGISDHDTVIWLGDFNYRIGLSSENARSLIKKRDLGTLYENDQLNLQMIAGLAFPYYSEAKINFLPTYKFDVGSDEYDTSEKARIPAWTDRILRKGSNIRQLSYNSAPLRFSDHRPVYATFQCSISYIDEELRDAISEELYQRRKEEVGDSTANVDGEDTEDEDLIGYDSIEPGLPASSSDRRKWWLDNGKPARVDMAVPKGPDGHQMVLNPRRPSNPFAPTEEPDWVAVSRSPSRMSTSTTLSSSPYEHVNLSSILSNSAPGNTPRRLPPAFDASKFPIQIGKLKMDDDSAVSRANGRQETPPPVPPPRRQTTQAKSSPPTAEPSKGADAPPTLPRRPSSVLSQTSEGSKSGKAPPPVARKPAHLSSSSPPPSQADGQSNGAHSESKPPLPTRTDTGFQRQSISLADSRARTSSELSVVRRPSQVPASQKTVLAKQKPTMAGATPLPGMVRTGAQALSKPASRNGHQAPLESGPDDLLGDLDDVETGGMGSWQTLRPRQGA